MARKHRFFGIDPGSRITGYGIIETDGHCYTPIDFGCIRPPPKLAFHERIHIIHESLEALIEKHAPEAIAIEGQFFHKNAQSALKLGMAKGAALLAATRHSVPLFEYAPTKTKLAVVGTGSGSKAQVQKMVQVLLGLSDIPHPEDAADALALAICHAHTIRNFS